MNNEIIYNYPEVAQMAKSIDVQKVRLSDTIFAENIANILDGKILFWRECNKWLVWNNIRWELDPPGNVFPYIKDIIKSIIANIINIDNGNSKNQYYNEIIKYEWHHKQETLISAMSVIPKTIVTCDMLDSNQMLLNCKNGIIDLETGDLLTHNPSLYITKLVDIDYHKNAECPEFISFINKIFSGNQNIINYLKRYFGYCLTGRTDEQIMSIFYGTGANGKTTLRWPALVRQPEG